VWPDTFKSVCEAHRLDYLDRLRYVMADYSPDVLATARRMVAPYRDKVSHLDIDFRRPLAALADLRGRVLFAHACNVHDNLPTDEVMGRGLGRPAPGRGLRRDPRPGRRAHRAGRRPRPRRGPG